MARGDNASLLVISPLLPRELSRRRARFGVEKDLLVVAIHRYAQLALYGRASARGRTAIARRMHGQGGRCGLARLHMFRPGVVHRPEKDDEDRCRAITAGIECSLA